MLTGTWGSSAASVLSREEVAPRGLEEVWGSAYVDCSISRAWFGEVVEVLHWSRDDLKTRDLKDWGLLNHWLLELKKKTKLVYVVIILFECGNRSFSM